MNLPRFSEARNPDFIYYATLNQMFLAANGAKYFLPWFPCVKLKELAKAI